MKSCWKNILADNYLKGCQSYCPHCAARCHGLRVLTYQHVAHQNRKSSAYKAAHADFYTCQKQMNLGRTVLSFWVQSQDEDAQTWDFIDVFGNVCDAQELQISRGTRWHLRIWQIWPIWAQQTEQRRLCWRQRVSKNQGKVTKSWMCFHTRDLADLLRWDSAVLSGPDYMQVFAPALGNIGMSW